MENILKQLLERGIKEQVFPGATAAVSCGSGADRKIWLAAVGNKDSRDLSAITADTLFDLASLSKALSTTLIYYSLFAENKIQPDATLADLLQEAVPSDKKQITLRSLLSHSSGFAAYQPWFRDFAPVQSQENKARLLRLIFDEPLVYPSASRCVYSDLGFILLGHLAEELTGKNLVANFRERITAPLGLEKELFYLPDAKEQARCAATESCSWRGRIIKGEVHDEHCWLLHGVAGHAGLFGTAAGVLRFCGAILDGWQGRDIGCSWSEYLSQGLQRQLPEQTWCLGFDTPSAGASSSGRYFSATSIGHLGFTGTSFWIDPEKELIVVLLTNRVHPSRENTKIRQFRPYFHDALCHLKGR
ncbi:MAG: CubicO group peptidase, beta-lactamase class C family [Candidatus Electronema aureum]|uniref:CubicO group peptidase, beta-lactamase class C family n=1 Tax=Candidatus Electronema aureum TaxID=2005002 RepID=A0A521G1D1_9BACT|nr:MAG: CubicO group peptidase, beta-lactamase class C family [Candidatus Electronema aureum]